MPDHVYTTQRSAGAWTQPGDTAIAPWPERAAAATGTTAAHASATAIDGSRATAGAGERSRAAAGSTAAHDELGSEQEEPGLHRQPRLFMERWFS
jgi:hypothetical protein